LSQIREANAERGLLRRLVVEIFEVKVARRSEVGMGFSFYRRRHGSVITV
jgi:hypothetical protein